MLNPTQTEWQGVPTSANFMFVWSHLKLRCLCYDHDVKHAVHTDGRKCVNLGAAIVWQRSQWVVFSGNSYF